MLHRYQLSCTRNSPRLVILPRCDCVMRRWTQHGACGYVRQRPPLRLKPVLLWANRWVQGTMDMMRKQQHIYRVPRAAGCLTTSTVLGLPVLSAVGRMRWMVYPRVPRSGLTFSHSRQLLLLRYSVCHPRR